MVKINFSKLLRGATHPVRTAIGLGIITPTRPAEGESNPPQIVNGPRAYSDSRLSAWIAEGMPGTGAQIGLPVSRHVSRSALAAGQYSRVEFAPWAGYSPPGRDVAFATVINDKYVMGLEALVLSLKAVYPDFDNTFLVFHDESLSAFSRARLHSLYGGFEFRLVEEDLSEGVTLEDAGNHARVGRLGYLSLAALSVEEFEWLVLLDADTVVQRDISALWTGNRSVKVVRDAGAVPFSFISPTTGAAVLNSGVIALPRSERGSHATARAAEVRTALDTIDDRFLNRFADQKFWNVYLAGSPVEYLPHNFNANYRLVEQYFPESAGLASIVHITGAKPWFDLLPAGTASDAELLALSVARRENPGVFLQWRREYASRVSAARQRHFIDEQGEDLARLAGSASGRPAVMIGNGPSLSRTDLSAVDGFEKFAFNWFVHHPDFDRVRPDHLVLASHKFFGDWNTATPSFPPGFLDALLAHRHQPRLWVSHYFAPLIEATPQLAGFSVSYFLFEKPFKSSLSKTGIVGLDLQSPLVDAHTGVLSAGVPIAVHLGVTAIVLVGCDSNYADETGSYFYAAEQHTSATTGQERLLDIWQHADGPGQYSYARVAEELADRGIGFADATVGGSLRTVPTMALADLGGLLSTAGGEPAHDDEVVRRP